MNGAAFLIGNMAYADLPPLRTPVSDVRTLGDRLEEMGFATSVLENVGATEMNSRISAFRAYLGKMPPNGSVLFYFAGHGAQCDGENFLLPTDASPINDEWRLNSLTLSSLLGWLCWRKDQQKLIVLDACRTNGIPSATRTGALGLSGVSTSNYADVHETMILYAARPGQVALDGGAIGSSPLCRGMLDGFERADDTLVNIVPRIAVRVDEYTAAQQDAWYTGNLKRLADRPFWHRPDPTEITSPHAPKPVPEAVIAHPHQFKSKVDELVASKGHLVHKLKAKDTSGQWAYYFVLVEAEQEAAFLEAINGNGAIELEDYGKVIASSYGDQPSQQVRDFLRDRYGWEV